MRRASRALRFLSLLSVAVAPNAFAQAGSGSNAECRSNPHLARARELYDDLQYEEAASTLQRAIEYSNNCRWDLAEIYRLKAFVDAVNGERERCHRDFEIFLALNPEYEMPGDVPPKIRKCYEDAKDVAPARRSLGLAHEVPQEAQPSAPVSIKVKVTDPLRLVDQIKVYFRREGVKVFTVVSARADDNVSIVIPALSVPPDPAGYKMEYVVRAVDRWDGVLTEEGNARRPLTFAVVPGSTEGSPFATWWFWTIAAVATAGLIGGGIVIANASQDTTTLSLTEGGP